MDSDGWQIRCPEVDESWEQTDSPAGITSTVHAYARELAQDGTCFDFDGDAAKIELKNPEGTVLVFTVTMIHEFVITPYTSKRSS